MKTKKENKTKIKGKEYLVFVSIIFGMIIALLSWNFIFKNFDNPFSGSISSFNEAVEKQPWQNSFLGNILGNTGASFIFAFLVLLEFPHIMVFLCISILTYKLEIKLVERSMKK